jgi:hypothetical protein
MITGNVEFNCDEFLGESNQAVIINGLVHDLPRFRVTVDMLTKLD